jgi:hypothetical protein
MSIYRRYATPHPVTLLGSSHRASPQLNATFFLWPFTGATLLGSAPRSASQRHALRLSSTQRFSFTILPALRFATRRNATHRDAPHLASTQHNATFFNPEIINA